MGELLGDNFGGGNQTGEPIRKAKRPREVDTAEPIRKPSVPCHLAVECAVGIANYCLTRFPCDTPPHPMLDVPWFAEKVQQCIDDAAKIGRDLARSLKQAEEEIAALKLLLVRKNEALGVFADPNCWVRPECRMEWNGDGGGHYADPIKFAKREMEADQPCETA